MTESNDGSRNPLLDEVANNRRVKESQKKAQEILPGFKAMLGQLISAKVTQEVETLVVTKENVNHLPSSRFRGYDDFGDIIIFYTNLTITVPLRDRGETVVVISASGYPKKGDTDLAKSLDYEIDIQELNKKLVIDGLRVRVESKERESEPFTEDTPLGVSLPSWPAWSHDATVEELQAYQKLIEECLNLEGVTFKGKTPKVINEDWTEYRKTIPPLRKLPPLSKP